MDSGPKLFLQLSFLLYDKMAWVVSNVMKSFWFRF